MVINKSLDRFISQWEPLIAFFKSQIRNSEKKTGRLEFQQIKKEKETEEILVQDKKKKFQNEHIVQIMNFRRIMLKNLQVLQI